jgi:hypothetical protein
VSREALVKARAAKVARAEAYVDHVAELCDAHRVVTHDRRSAGGRATPRLRMVSFGPICGIVSYYVALHEIGHCVGRGRSAPVLECEGNAWQWAIDNAIVAPSPAVWKMIRRCLGNYHARHERMARRRYVRFPPEDHVFWRLAEIEPHTQRNGGRNAAD